jgi:phospholipid/cholesterol/gamma-HCH transport system substrate-binding protein
MPKRYLAVGIFIIAGITLFALGIFLVGSRHEAFSRHVLLYTEFANLDGITKGSKVQVSGMDAGQVAKIDVPNSPNGRFHVQMRVDERFHGLVRTDSVVTVDTEGVVGDTFLTIHTGSPDAPIAQADSLLQSKPPVNMTDLFTDGLGVINDADATLKQVTGKLNAALDGTNDAIGNANDLLIGLKEGRGPAGMLLSDEKMSFQIRETLATIQLTTSNLKQASAGVSRVVADIQQRQLPQKLDDTMTQIHSASTQANATIEQVHQSLTQALGPDVYGATAGQNMSQTLSNVNFATGNMAEDTEALKHNIFFKGFFRQRGYYNLSSLSPSEYRRARLFDSSHNPRVWLRADSLFQQGQNGSEELSHDGKRAIDAAVVSLGDAIFTHPIVVEGYSDAVATADALSWSYARAQVVRNYLEARYPFEAKNVGVMPLSATPPIGLEHRGWSAGGMVTPQAEAADAEPALVAMGRRSLSLWPEWLCELPTQVHYSASGSLLLWQCADVGEATRFQALLRTRDPEANCQRLDGQQLAVQEPSLEGRFREALYLPGEAHVDNRQLLPALADALDELGVECHWNRRVEDTELPDACVVIDCRGKNAKSRWKELRGVRGELVRLHAPDVELRHMVRLLHPRYSVYLISRPGGNLVVGATAIESDDSSPVSVRSALELLTAAYSVVPEVAEARIVELNCDCRPALPDNRPAIRYSPAKRVLEINGLYRHGFLLSPAVVEETLTILPDLLENPTSELRASPRWPLLGARDEVLTCH